MKSVRRFARRAGSSSRKATARRSFVRRGLLAERLETRALMAGDLFVSDYWNSDRPLDVNTDGSISPIDALMVINQLNATGTVEVGGVTLQSGAIAGIPAEGETSDDHGYTDVNNDGFISPIDALMVINALNGEGEPLRLAYRIYAVPVGTQVTETATPPTSLTQVAKGQDYELVVTVKDLRSGTQLGPAAGYLDIFYDPTLTTTYVNEIQDIVVNNNNGGSFTLTFGGQTTTAITWDPFSPEVVATSIDTQLEALPNIGAGDVQVSGNGNTFRVKFVNGLGDQNVTEISGNGGGLTGGGTIGVTTFAQGVVTDPIAFSEAWKSEFAYPNANNRAFFQGQFNAGTAEARISTLTQGGVATNEVQRLSIARATSGTFTLTFNGQTTTPIVFNASAGAIQSALEALSNIDPGDVTVNSVATSELNTLAFNVTFTGNLGNTNVNPLTSNVANLLTNRVDDLGGTYLETTPVNQGGIFPGVFERELARVRMNANQGGFVTFTPSLADFEFPAHESLLYADPLNPTQKSNVLVADIDLGPSVTLEITEPVEANPDIVTLTEDASAFTFNPITGVPGGSEANGQDVKNAGAAAPNLRITAVNGVTTATGAGTAVVLASGSTVFFNPSTTTTTITYTPAANLAGTPAETFTYTISDTVNFDSTTVTINLNALNDRPVNRIGGVAINNNVLTGATGAVEDTAFVFSGARQLTVADVDFVAAEIMQLALSVTPGSGILALSTTAGLSFTGGTNNSASMTFTGSLTAINNAINNLTYTPAQDFNGNTTFAITSDDQGNTGTPGALSSTLANSTITINVAARNDAPVNSVPGAQTVIESTNLVFNAANLNPITVADVDALGGTFDGGRLRVTVESSLGRTITANTSGTAIISPFGTGGVQIRGSVAEVNLALSGLTYAAGSFLTGSSDTITVTTNDQGNSGTSNLQGNDGVAPDPLVDIDTIAVNIEAARRPFAQDDTFNRTEGPGTFTMDVMKFLSGLPGEDLFTASSTPFIVSTTGPTNTAVQGTVTFTLGVDGVPSADDRIVYTPPAGNPHYFGTVHFSYTISEMPISIDGPDTADVTLIITPDNDNPVAVNDPAIAGAYFTNEDINLVVNAANGVLANDTDLDNTQDQDGDGDPDPTQTLRAVLVSDAANGTVTLNDDGSFTYDPDLNFAGPTDSFTYHVDDGEGGISNVATVTIIVNPVDDSPVANNDPAVTNDPNYSTPEGNPLSVSAANGLLANDTDVDTSAGNLTAIQVTQPALGQGTITAFGADGSFTYTPPNSDFNGTVTFTYKVNDGNSDSNIATVTIRVTPVNDPPVVANDPGIVTSEDTAIDINVLGNDTDVDGDTLSVFLPLVIQPANGTVTVNPNGTLKYTPNNDYFGPDSFQYRAFDGTTTSVTGGTLNDGVATVSITVLEFNDLPIAVNDGTAASPLSTNEDVDLEIDVVANDDDGDDNLVQVLTPVNVSALSNPAAGTLTVLPNNRILFDPANNFSGDVSFTYQVRDDGVPNQTSANTATVFLRVVEQNDPPTAFDDFFTAIKDFVDQPIDVINGDLPHDTIAPDVGETLSISGVSTTGVAGTYSSTATTAQGGTVTIVFDVALGRDVVHYDSPLGFESGPLDSFFYELSDGRTGTDTAMVTVDVLAFVPKFVEGVVYIDGDNNGQIFAGESFTDANSNGVYDAGEAFADSVGGTRDNNRYDAPEKRVQGVKVQLAGTDFQDNPVFFETTTDAQGRYRFVGDAATQFQGLQPGTYTVTEIHPSYLTDGVETESSALAVIGADDRFDIAWGADDFSGHISGLNFGERGINANSLAESGGLIQEILASSGPNGLVITTDLAGGYVWSWAMPGWNNMLQCQLDLDADLAHATLTVTDGQGTYVIRIHQETQYNGHPAHPNSPPAGSMARFRVLGHSASGQYLIRLDGTAADFGLNLLAAAPVFGEGEAEGEAVNREYADAVDAVFSEGEALA